MESQYYTAFVTFGSYCINSNVISSSRFANFLIKKEIKLVAWATDVSYTAFLEYFIFKESVKDALTRSIEYTIKWGKQNDDQPQNIFINASVERICHEINGGQISPWMIYFSKSGAEFILQLDPGYHDAIWNMIDIDKWTVRFDNSKDDIDYAKDILTLGGW
jgi:hypothetical protein